jgi:hypothetical protein
MVLLERIFFAGLLVYGIWLWGTDYVAENSPPRNVPRETLVEPPSHVEPVPTFHDWADYQPAWHRHPS